MSYFPGRTVGLNEEIAISDAMQAAGCTPRRRGAFFQASRPEGNACIDIPPPLGDRLNMPARVARIISMVFCVLSGPASSAPSTVPAPEMASVPRLTQYGHSVWHTQDGLFSSPNSIAQSKDGYLWFGTDAGLVRFDGVRFLAWNTLPGGPISGRRVGAALAAADGSLWFGVSNEVVGWGNGRSFRYKVAGRITQLAQDGTGAVWIASQRTEGRGPLCRVTNGELRCFDASEVPLPYVSSLSASKDGTLWLGGSYGLCRWAQSRPSDCYLRERLKSQASLIGVTAIQTTRDGTLWIGIGRAGRGLGLGQFIDGRWNPVVMAGLDGSTLSVSSLMEDRNGSLWIGTFDHGLYRIHRGRIEHFGFAEGLSSDSVAAGGLYEDREGTVWVLTPRGLDAFRRLPVALFSAREGLPAEGVESVLPARDGTVWFGNLTLSMLSDDRTAPAPHAELFQGRAVTSMLEDHAGRLWVGLDNTLNIFEKGQLKPITTPNGAALGLIENIAEDTSHDVWVSTATTAPQLLRIHAEGGEERVVEQSTLRPLRMAPDPAGGIWMGFRDGTLVHRLSTGNVATLRPDAFSSAPAWGIHVDPNGMLLVATTKGLLVQRGESRLLLNRGHGLPCDDFREVVRDDRKSVWLLSVCGIVELSANELDGWLANPSGKVQVRLFDVTDGAQPGNGSFMPHASLGRDGRVWFANGKVAQVIDPSMLEVRKPVPPAMIEEVTADRTVFQPATSLKLPARTRDIEIRYTAVSFVAPQKVRFRYRLEGRDAAWVDADTRRQAFYTDLPPGSYRFHVVAGNSDGVWSEVGASQDFEIPPVFYQTRWFVVLCVAGALALLYSAFLIRLRQMAARAGDRLAARDAERERIARDLHDTLLQSNQALILQVQAAVKELAERSPGRDKLEKALDRADEVMDEARERVAGLRSSGHALADLPLAIEALGVELAQGSAVFRSRVEGVERSLHAGAADEAWSIVREALLNAFRHANASSVGVVLTYGADALRIVVRDDGRGIDFAELEAGARPGHWGLPGMRERAERLGASLDVQSVPGAGTTIDLQIPAHVAYPRRPTFSFGWRRRRR